MGLDCGHWGPGCRWGMASQRGASERRVLFTDYFLSTQLDLRSMEMGCRVIETPVTSVDVVECGPRGRRVGSPLYTLSSTFSFFMVLSVLGFLLACCSFLRRTEGFFLVLDLHCPVVGSVPSRSVPTLGTG